MEGAQERAEKGELVIDYFGWSEADGWSAHDRPMPPRTMLYNIKELKWDDGFGNQHS